MERPGIEVNPASLERLQRLIYHLREEVIPNWAQVDPGPPNANLSYTEIDEMLEEIQSFSPTIRESLDQALAPARAQVEMALKYWENGSLSRQPLDYARCCCGTRPQARAAR